MSSKGNKKAREALRQIYGDGCFIERAGIRKITVDEEVEMKRTLKGFKKLDRTITYHHLRPKCKGGKATVENGANLARYNHDWLEQLPPDKKEQVNNKLRQFKLSICSMSFDERGRMQVDDAAVIEVPEFIGEDDYIVIPAYDTPPKQKYNRAKVKREYQRYVDEEMEDYER